MIDAELITDLAQLKDVAPAWDELAVANAQPMCSPTWMLGWWRHLAPSHMSMRVIAVRERDRLIGLGPFFVDTTHRGRVDYRLLSYATPRISPLAIPGQEWKVARAVAETLSRADPRPDVVALEQVPLSSQWAVALREEWPGQVRPPIRQYSVKGSPTVSLRAGSFESWLTDKSSSFRGEMRKHRRKFAALGGLARMSTEDTLSADIASFVRLHTARWEGRGTSDIATRQESWSAMLQEIGREHLSTGRLRIWVLEIEREPIAAQLCAAAGGEVILLNSGWDEQFARLSPAMLGMLAAIEDSFARGDRRIDLAPGEQQFKLRLADGNDPVAWTILMAPGWRLPLTGARVAPMLTRVAVQRTAKRSLSQQNADRLRRLRKQWRRESL